MQNGNRVPEIAAAARTLFAMTKQGQARPLALEAADSLRYVVITPARNEAQYIRKTIDSMVSQTRQPLRWVIVSDGSTDGTDDIVTEYARQVDWIELVRLPEHRDRSFAAKVH